jgi:hypothetical protein
MKISLDITNASTTIVQNESVNITMISKGTDVINITDVGFQGLPGAQGIQGPKGDIGEPLEFEDLSEGQKIELRGDVGDTSSVNYANLLYSTFLS